MEQHNITSQKDGQKWEIIEESVTSIEYDYLYPPSSTNWSNSHNPNLPPERPPYPLEMTEETHHNHQIKQPFSTSTNYVHSTYPINSQKLTDANEAASKMSNFSRPNIETSRNVGWKLSVFPLNSFSSTSPNFISRTEYYQLIMSKLSKIKSELSQNTTRERRKFLKSTLKEISQEMELNISKMTSEEKKLIAHELSQIEAAYFKVSQGKKESSIKQQYYYSRSLPYKSEKNGKYSLNYVSYVSPSKVEVLTKSVDGNIAFVGIGNTTAWGINITSLFKVLQMMLNAFSILCCFKLSSNFYLLFTIYWATVSIFALLISIFLLWYIVTRATESVSKKYMKLEVNYSILMTILYVIITCFVFSNLGFVYQSYFFFSLILGIFVIAIYSLDAWHTAFYRFPATK